MIFGLFLAPACLLTYPHCWMDLQQLCREAMCCLHGGSPPLTPRPPPARPGPVSPALPVSLVPTTELADSMCAPRPPWPPPRIMPPPRVVEKEIGEKRVRTAAA